jgi:hypothetical protein
MARVGCSYELILRQCKERNHTVNNRKRKSPLTADWGVLRLKERRFFKGGTYTVHRTPFTVQSTPVYDTKNSTINYWTKLEVFITFSFSKFYFFCTYIQD